jgi:hypothetical protein
MAACPVNDAGVTQLGTLQALSDIDASFTAIEAIAADGDGLYLVVMTDDFTGTTTHTVYRMPPCGGAASLLGSRTSRTNTGGGAVFSALAASGRVFLIMGDGIYSLPTSGGAMATETTDTMVDLGHITVYGDQLYWIDGNSTLWAVTTGGGSAAHTIASATGASWTSVAADASNVYVTAIPLQPDGGALVSGASGSAPNAGPGGSVLAIALPGGAITTLASGLYAPADLVVNGSSLYFTSNMYQVGTDTLGGSGVIQTLPLGGGPVTVIVRDDQAPPGPPLLIGSTLYWIAYGGPDGWQRIRSQPSGGTPLYIPMPRLIGLDGVILSSSGAYWYSSRDYSFGRIAL